MIGSGSADAPPSGKEKPSQIASESGALEGAEGKTEPGAGYVAPRCRATNRLGIASWHRSTCAAWRAERTDTLMPRRPLTPCPDPTCSTLGPCAQHGHMMPRPSASRRGYGGSWRALRASILQRDPICAVKGCGRASVDVDHIVPRARGGIDHPINLRGMCHEHHAAKTATSDGGFGNVAVFG